MLVQFLNAKQLSISDYGDVNIIFSFQALAASFSVIVGKVLVKYFVIFEKNSYLTIHFKDFVLSLINYFVLFYIFFLILFSNSLNSYFSIANSYYLYLISIPIILNYYFQIPLSFFQSKKLYFLNGLYSSGLPILRLVITIMLIYFFSLSIFGVILAFIISTLIVFFFSYIRFIKIQNKFYLNNNDIEVSLDKNTKKEIYNIFWMSLVLIISYVSLMSIDLLVIKRVLGSYEAGIYSAYQMYSKIIYFLMSPIAIFLLPETINKKRKELVKMIIFCFIFLSIGAIPAMYIFYNYETLLFSFLFDSKYFSNFKLSFNLLLSFYIYGLIHVYVIICLAKSLYSFSFILIFSNIFFIIICYKNYLTLNIFEISKYFLFTNILTFILSSFFMVIYLYKKDLE